MNTVLIIILGLIAIAIAVGIVTGVVALVSYLRMRKMAKHLFDDDDDFKDMFGGK